MNTSNAARRAVKIALLWGTLSLCVGSARGEEPKFNFELIGGHFYGPGPIVPDTNLPDGRLRNIRFDTNAFQGYCEFANDGGPAGRLSDGRTRVNQNIDAGHLRIGGGTSTVLLAAVDGGPHQGTEQYYLDDQYRFVWRVDIALDPGFEEGIIRLNDFVLDTGVVRIGRSLQSRRGEPGGYDQAGSLPAGTFLAGRVGDFDQDGLLDGVLVAAPNVPLAADMLPGAPVGNQRGFRTDIPISAALSAELMLRGALHLRDPLRTLIDENSPQEFGTLAAELVERVRVIQERFQHAARNGVWPQTRGKEPGSTLARLSALRADAVALTQDFSSASRRLAEVSTKLETLVAEVSALNAAAGTKLPIARVVSSTSAEITKELHQKSY